MEKRATPTTSDGALDFQALVDRLVPPESVEVVDVYGGRHRLVTTVSARRQTALFRALRAALARPAVDVALRSAGAAGVGSLVEAATSGHAGTMAGVVAVIGSDEGVISDLGDAFAAAYPGAVEAARARSVQAGDPQESAADLFGVEELLAGLLPLSVRLARRGTSALLALASASGA